MLLESHKERGMEKKPKTPKHNYYVSNKALYPVIVQWKKDVKKAQKEGLPNTPPLPEFVGECMIKIATKFSQKPSFIRYTFRDEMIADALESCCRYIHNFNPAKSKNAFAYITQIVSNAFLRRLQKEQKQLYVKMKIVDSSDFIDSYERQDGDSTNYNNSYITYLQENKGDIITKFEKWKENKKNKATAKKNSKLAETANIQHLFEGSESVPENIVLLDAPTVSKKKEPKVKKTNMDSKKRKGNEKTK